MHILQIAEGYTFHINVKVKSHRLVVFDGGNLAQCMHDPIDFPGNPPPLQDGTNNLKCVAVQAK